MSLLLLPNSRSHASRKQVRRDRPELQSNRRVRRIFFEPLEDRRLLATLPAIDRGTWSEGGHSDNGNTFTGEVIGLTFNSFFVFSTSGLDNVTSATLRLEVEGYFGPSSSESLTVWNVSSPINTLTAFSGPNASVLSDLQSGTSFGNFTVSSSQVGSIRTITLNSQAVAAINASVSSGKFAIGVHATSITSTGDAEGVRFSALEESRVHELVVVEGNQPPVVPAISAKAVDEGSLLSFTVTATDQDALTYSLVSPPAGAAIHPTSGLFTWTPSDDGEFDITVRVTDNGTPSMSTTRTFHVSVDNVEPSNLQLALVSESIDENGVATLSGSFTDPGSDDSHSLFIDWGDGSTLQEVPLAAGAKTFSGITHPYLDDGPSPGNGTPSDPYDIQVTVVDDDAVVGASESTTVTVNNVAPQLTLALSDAELNENENTTLTGTITDPGTLDEFTLDLHWGDPLSPDNIQSFELGATPLTVAVDGIDWNPVTREFSLPHQYLDDNPSGTSSDEYFITATVADDDGVNDDILFVSDSSSDLSIPTALGSGYDITVVTEDFANGNSALLADLSSYAAVFWSATGTGAGSITSPAVIANLTNYVTAGGSLFVTGYDSIASPTDLDLVQFLGGTGVVDNTGDPVLGPIANVITSLSAGLFDLRNVTPTGGYSDKDAFTGLQPGTIGLTSSAAGVQWTVRPLGTGEVAYVSNGASSGTSFDNWLDTSPGGDGAYNAALRNFAFAAAGLGSDAASETLSVEVVNVDPVAAAFTPSTTEDEPLTPFNVLTGASDAGTLDLLQAVADSGAGSIGGVFTIAATGMVTFDPNGDFEYLSVGQSTTTSFTYSIVDDDGGTDSNTVTVAINGVNDAPTALPDANGMAENVAIAIDVLENDVDPDSADIRQLVSFSIASMTFDFNSDPIPVVSATVGQIGDAFIQFVPGTDFDFLPAGETATVVIDYTMRDGRLAPLPTEVTASSSSTLTLTVSGVNDAPTATGESYSLAEDNTLDVLAPGVLGNDDDVDFGATLTAVLVSGPAHSSAFALNEDGSFSYTPAANYYGPDSFTYKANDGELDSSVVTVSLTVTPVDDFDFGDAPASYGVAAHFEGAGFIGGPENSGPLLGTRDFEVASQHSPTADGDDALETDDEDGVTYSSTTLVPRLNTIITVNATATGVVDAWIDFDRNGTFDAGEKIAAGLSVVAGSNQFTITTPEAAVAGETYARFRISTAGSALATGLAADGEVEDHPLSIMGLTPGTSQVIPDPENPEGPGILLVNGTSSTDAIIVQQTAYFPVPLVTVYIAPYGTTASFPLDSFEQIVVFGYDGNDSIVIQYPLDKPAAVYGDNGHDTISGGVGSDFLDGGNGMDTIAGGAGNDIVVGGADNDTLSGDAGRDLILGGGGLDFLMAGLDDDIEIGGTLVDSSQGNLESILALWTGASPFETRIGSLAGKLNSTTVLDDGVADYVYGSTGRDWLLDYALRDFFFDYDANPWTGDRKN